MEITHYISPRNSGKTIFAKNLQMESPENTLLIITETKSNINDVFRKLRGVKYDRVIIDELTSKFLNPQNVKIIKEIFNPNYKVDTNNKYRSDFYETILGEFLK